MEKFFLTSAKISIYIVLLNYLINDSPCFSLSMQIFWYHDMPLTQKEPSNSRKLSSTKKNTKSSDFTSDMPFVFSNVLSFVIKFKLPRYKAVLVFKWGFSSGVFPITFWKICWEWFYLYVLIWSWLKKKQVKRKQL